MPSESPNKDKKQWTLQVGGQHYPAVKSVLDLIASLAEYIQCASQLPFVSAEVLQRMCEYLKLFNSRTCQLLLGAGALQLAGLKSITASNLALASRAIALVAVQVPLLRAALEQQLAPAQRILLNTLDSVSGVSFSFWVWLLFRVDTL